MRIKILIAALTLMFFSACKKENAASLKGLWTVDNIVYKSYVNNVLDDTETEPGNGATLNFRDDGKAVYSEPGSADEISSYTIEGSKVTSDGTTFEIQNLSSTKVTLFHKDDYGGGDYEEVYLNLKR